MAFGIVVTCGWGGMILALAELPSHPFWGPVYVNGIEFLVGLALVGLLGWGRVVGLEHLRGGLLVIPLVLLSGTEAWPGLGGSVDRAVILLCVGLNEELWSRGIVLTALRRRLGPYGCAIGVAVLFGLQHLINLWWGQSADDTAVQIIEAAAFGFALAALRVDHSADRTSSGFAPAHGRAPCPMGHGARCPGRAVRRGGGGGRCRRSRSGRRWRHPHLRRTGPPGGRTGPSWA